MPATFAPFNPYKYQIAGWKSGPAGGVIAALRSGHPFRAGRIAAQYQLDEADMSFCAWRAFLTRPGSVVREVAPGRRRGEVQPHVA